MKYFLRYLKPHVLTMCFGFFIKFSGTIMDLLIPYILSYIIDEVTPKNDIGLVVRWGLLMILCAALVLLTNVWANRIASAVSRERKEYGRIQEKAAGRACSGRLFADADIRGNQQ